MTSAVAPHARPKAVPIDWDDLRNALQWNRRVARPEDVNLLGPTVEWLNTLPTGARPRQLQLGFAFVTNRICAAWHDQEALKRLFFKLLHDHRGNRKGFPPMVREELKALQSYSAHCVPSQRLFRYLNAEGAAALTL